MARRSILVAIATIGAALLPANAWAVSAPTGFSAIPAGGTTTPVALGWTAPPDAASQAALRAPGACASLPQAGEVQVGAPPVPMGGGPSVASDTPPDGTWCYYARANDADPMSAIPVAYSGGVTVTVDRPSTGSVGVQGLTNGFVHGSVNVVGSAADAGSGVASSSLRASQGDCLTTGVPVGAGWTPVGDGVYNVCNVVTDGAGHITVVQTIQVTVDNTAPTGTVTAPADQTAVSGTIPLTIADADLNGIASVQWRWAGANGALHNIGGAGAGNRTWNTATGNGHPPDGAAAVSAVVTDNAGNQGATAAIGVLVDNTAPDVAAVVTAPPAVAGSPTLSWTPAHDAIGIARYSVLRGGTVIGTVTNVPGAQTYSFNDKNAPDQATSSYVVRAFDATDHSADSVAVAVLVDSKAQSAPRGLAAATPTDTAPALNWQAPGLFNVAHYDLYRDGLLLGSTPGPQTSYTDSSAPEGVHDYAVLARDGAAHPGVLSASFKVVYDTTPPTSGGAPTAQLLTNGSVQLAWPLAGDALSGVAGYVVRRANGGTPPAGAEGGTAVCTPTDAGCTDASTTSGTWSYGVFARDAAGNVALIGTVAGVLIDDKTAPLAPAKLRVSRAKSRQKTAEITFTVRWAKPTAPDLDRVVVVLNLKHAPKEPADGRAIYHGLGTSTKVKLRPGQTGYLALFAYDHSGNVSLKPARNVVRLAALIPLRPLTGSVVRSSAPLLTWKAKKGTAYYNVQLFINGTRVLVGWPSKAAYRIPAGKLMPGTYVWYVWPAVKRKKGSPSFGKLIGRATFTYKK
jgi:hypothetical protein